MNDSTNRDTCRAQANHEELVELILQALPGSDGTIEPQPGAGLRPILVIWNVLIGDIVRWLIIPGHQR